MRKPTSWWSRKTEGRQADGKGGRGLFAIEPIAEGEQVVVFGGEVITRQQVLRLSAKHLRSTIQVAEDLYLYSHHDGPGDWVNHSCAPNAGLSGQIVLVALRDIEPGEEICFDYATCDGTSYDEFECSCGASDCRGRVTGDDWERAEVQARLRGAYSPYLMARSERHSSPR